MLTIDQATTMLSMQGAMNSKVDPNWVSARHPYLRAIVIEGAEAIEHHGWKWWKKQDKDLPQLQMELIDIWHFILSEILLNNDGNEGASLAQLQELLTEAELHNLHERKISFDSEDYSLNAMDLIQKLELLIAVSVSKRIELALFESIMIDCKMNWTELYCQYVGKNVLNFFRQDHGYKEGTYKKVWDGREDNEYLVEIMGTLSPNASTLQDEIYSALKQYYPS
jgi:hypothetical protein|tara:strand:- start:3223 stop:3894 length:672 start_codon:yes stop_codon:yes gene_type:complete